MAKMEKVSVSANIKENGKVVDTRTAEVNYSFPETVQEAVKMFGEEVCLSKITQSVTIDLQGNLRRRLGQGQTVEQLQTYVDNVNHKDSSAPVQPWRPGVSAPRKSKTETILSAYDKLSDEEKAALLQRIKSKQTGK